MMKPILLAVLVLAIAACNVRESKMTSHPVNLDSIKQVLMKADKDFSDLSKVKGRNFSFLEYMDKDVTFLRDNGMPLLGKDTMQKRFAVRPDTSYVLTWKPLFADVASSGDLGYSYGRWLLVTTTNDSSEGTYCTIWKSDSAGNWKYVLDTGNEGLKEKK